MKLCILFCWALSLLSSTDSASVTVNIKLCPTNFCQFQCATLSYPNNGACVMSDTAGPDPRNWIYKCAADLQTVQYLQWNNNSMCGGPPKYTVTYLANSTLCQEDMTDGNFKMITCVSAAAPLRGLRGFLGVAAMFSALSMTLTSLVR